MVLQQIQFNTYLISHQKQYSPSEYQYRFQVYRENMAYIRAHNKLGKDYVFGANQFTDMTSEEFRNLVSKPIPKTQRHPVRIPTIEYPADVDWNQQGAVTPVQKQGNCLSSWAFACVGAVQGIWKIKNNPLVELSVQELVDCSGSYGNDGCDGGTSSFCYRYIRDKGVTNATEYPYLGYQSNCDAGVVGDVVARISSFRDLPEDDMDQIISAVVEQPVYVNVDASSTYWQNYKTGVINEYSCGTSLDHSVLIIGYDMHSPTDYWLVKNSWGTDWGIKGYAKVGMIDGEGYCGINKTPSIPIIN